MTIRRFIQLQFSASLVLVIAASIIAGLAIINQRDLAASQRLRMESYRLAVELRQSSDDLTRFARAYVVTADAKFEQYYRDVLAIRNGQKPRPDGYDHRIYWDLVADSGRAPQPDTTAVPLEQLMRQAGFTDAEFAKLAEAQRLSDTLVKTEDAAMHLVKGEYADESGAFTKRGRPDQASAIRMTFDPAYFHEKARIMGAIDEFLVMLDERTGSSLDAFTSRSAADWRLVQTAMFGLLSLLVVSYPLVHRRVFAPVAALQQQTQLMAADLDRLANVAGQNARGNQQMAFVASSQPLGLARSDEIGDLARLHDNMIGRLQETGAAVATLTAGMRRSIDEDRRRADQVSRELQRRVHELAGIGTYVIDMNARTIRLSVELAHLLRIGAEAVDMPLDDYRRRFYFETDREPAVTRADAAYAAGASVHLEARVVRGDGDVIWVRTSSNSEHNTRGEPVVVGVVQDITESRLALLKLREQAETIAGVRDVVFSMTPEGIFTSLNPAFERVTGLRAAEWLGQPYISLVHPDDVARSIEEFRAAITGVQASNPPVRVRTATNEYRLADIEVTTRTEGGRVTSVMGIARDVTQREEALQQVRESEERFRQLAESSIAGIYIVQDGVLSYVNPAMETMAGAAPGALLGTDPLLLVHPDDRPVASEHLRRRTAGETETTHYEARGLRKDGTIVWYELLGSRTTLGGRPALIGMLIDVTARRQAGEALKKSETRFRTLIEQAPIAVSVTRAGSRLYVNQKYRDMYGIGTTDVSKLPITEGVAPEAREQLAERARRRSAGLPEPDEYEIIAQRPDGTRFPMHVAVAMLELPDGPAHVAFLTDISEWKAAEARIAYVNRLYAMLSSINETIVRERNLQAVLEAACRIAVDKGGFRMAWIGMVDAAGRRVEPVASAGAVDGYLDNLQIDLSAEALRMGPTGRCVTSGEHQTSGDIANDPRMAPWRNAALERGYRSSGSFPLTVDGRVVGTFNLYAAEPNGFDVEELRLLDGLAMDIGFALEMNRRETERPRPM